MENGMKMEKRETLKTVKTISLQCLHTLNPSSYDFDFDEHGNRITFHFPLFFFGLLIRSNFTSSNAVNAKGKKKRIYFQFTIEFVPFVFVNLIIFWYFFFFFIILWLISALFVGEKRENATQKRNTKWKRIKMTKSTTQII